MDMIVDEMLAILNDRDAYVSETDREEQEN